MCYSFGCCPVWRIATFSGFYFPASPNLLWTYPRRWLYLFISILHAFALGAAAEVSFGDAASAFATGRLMLNYMLVMRLFGESIDGGGVVFQSFMLNHVLLLGRGT